MPEHPVRIGVVFTKLGGLDTSALKYLILYQNTLQKSFQFELLPADEDEEFLLLLDSHAPVGRETIEEQIGTIPYSFQYFTEFLPENGTVVH